MKRLIICMLVALLMAGVLGTAASTTPFKQRLLGAEVDDALPAPVADALDDESVALNTVFLAYADDEALWLSARLAMLRHGDIAREVLVDHGLDADFQRALARFGADTVLPVAYFQAHDIATLNLRHWASQRYQQASRTLSDWWSSDEAGDNSERHSADTQNPAPPTADSGAIDSSADSDVRGLTPHQRGDYAIAWLNRDEHEVLDQFVVDDHDRVVWLQSERVLSDISDFFTSGIRDLERKWQQGEAIRATDAAWAGVDLLAMTSAVKVLRAGRGVRVGSAEARGAKNGPRASRGLLPGLRFSRLSRTAKVAAVGATSWLVVRHPSLVSAFGASLAAWLDWPVRLGQFLLWAVVLTPLLWLGSWFYRWLVGPLLWLLYRLLRLTVRSRREMQHA